MNKNAFAIFAVAAIAVTPLLISGPAEAACNEICQAKCRHYEPGNYAGCVAKWSVINERNAGRGAGVRKCSASLQYCYQLSGGKHPDCDKNYRIALNTGTWPSYNGSAPFKCSR